MQTHLHTPSAGGPHPAVILYFDAFGVRPAMHDIAQQLADDGYVVALPNVFYRAGDYKPFDPQNTFNNREERERLMPIMQQASVPAVVADTKALLDVLDARPEVQAGKAGAFGYCMGRSPGVLRGGGLISASASPPSPASTAATSSAKRREEPASTRRTRSKRASTSASPTRIRAARPQHQGILASALAGKPARVRYAIELYQGKRHGFAVRDHGAYDADANAQHWTRLRELFAAELKAR